MVNTKKTAQERKDSLITLTKKDPDGTALTGAVFTLYDADENTVFLGNASKISTNGEEYAIEVTEKGAFIAGKTYKGQKRSKRGEDDND